MQCFCITFDIENIRLRSVALRWVGVVINFLEVPEAAHPIERQVVSDSVKPRRYTSSWFVICSVKPQPQESFLHDILGVGRVPQQPQDKEMEPFGVAPNEVSISVGIAFPHSHDEQSIVVGLLPAVRVRH